MPHATVDDRGRLYLPKDAREQYGDQYRIVKLKDGVKLVRSRPTQSTAFGTPWTDSETCRSKR